MEKRKRQRKQRKRQITYVRPPVTDYQARFLSNECKVWVIQAGTKTGKTTGCLLWLFEQALREPGIYWWVSPVAAQAKMAMRRLQKAANPPGIISETNKSEGTLTLVNGSVLWFKNAQNPDNLFGEDVSGLVVDEATRVKEKSWDAVRSTLTATGGHARIIANVKGKRNWVYELYQRALKAEAAIEAGIPPGIAHLDHETRQKVLNGEIPFESVTVQGAGRYYGAMRITTWEAAEQHEITGVHVSEIYQAKASLKDHVFRELYEAVPTDDGTNPFGYSYLEKAQLPELAEGPAVFFGIDWAKQIDETAVVGLNKDGDVAYTDSFRGVNLSWEEIQERACRPAARNFAVMDQTGIGGPLFEAVRNRFPRMRAKGYTFTAQSKKELYDALVLAIQRGATRFPASNPGDEQLADQLFEMEVTYSSGDKVKYEAPPGKHDDYADAYALAWRCREENIGKYRGHSGGRRGGLLYAGGIGRT